MSTDKTKGLFGASAYEAATKTNYEGAPTFLRSDEEALVRVLITGTLEPTYYADANELASEAVALFKQFTATGAVRWRYHVPLATPANIADLVLEEDVLLVDWNADHLRALDAATGAPLWDFAAAHAQYALHSVPVIAGGIVYLINAPGEQDILLAIGLRDGRIRWQHDESAPGRLLYRVNPAVDGVQLFGVVIEDGSTQEPNALFHVAAFSLADGHVLWTSPTFSANRVNTLRAADGLVVATDIFTEASVFEASTGKSLLRYPQPPPTPSDLTVMSGAALADGTVYLELADGTNLALDARTGAVGTARSMAPVMAMISPS